MIQSFLTPIMVNINGWVNILESSPLRFNLCQRLISYDNMFLSVLQTMMAFSPQQVKTNSVVFNYKRKDHFCLFVFREAQIYL